ncbi:hypothetical protein Tco_0221567 [Tanacetum coccineum]
MGYLVYAYYNISPTRFNKDDSWWSENLKSKTIEDFISIGSFMEVLGASLSMEVDEEASAISGGGRVVAEMGVDTALIGPYMPTNGPQMHRLKQQRTLIAAITSRRCGLTIERLQQGESLNVQDVKTNLFWEFGKFTSRDGESMESYYSRFYKLMNELTRNNLQVSPMQVNVQFLQQLQPEWSRFVTVVKQRQEIDTVSYHKLFDVLKQFQNEAPKPQRSNAPSYMQSSSTRPSASTRHKGKEIAKPVTPQSEKKKSCTKPTTTTLRTSFFKLQEQDESDTTQVVTMTIPAEQFPTSKRASDWLEDTDEEIDEQELEAHYSYMAKIQEVSPAESTVLEKDDSNVIPDSSNICTNDNQVDQNAAECVDERAALANLIANLTLDTEENNVPQKAQSENLVLYENPNDTSDPAKNRVCPNGKRQ